MKNQGKPQAAADKQAARKPKAKKAQAVKLRLAAGGVSVAVSEAATEGELLKALVVGTIKISEQVEALRRTLWRIGEVREYEGKGAKAGKGKPKADAGKGADK